MPYIPPPDQVPADRAPAWPGPFARIRSGYEEWSSLPTRGAWIEISAPPATLLGADLAPHAGVWIETSRGACDAPSATRRSPRGAWESKTIPRLRRRARHVASSHLFCVNLCQRFGKRGHLGHHGLCRICNLHILKGPFGFDSRRLHHLRPLPIQWPMLLVCSRERSLTGDSQVPWHTSHTECFLP